MGSGLSIIPEIPFDNPAVVSGMPVYPAEQNLPAPVPDSKVTACVIKKSDSVPESCRVRVVLVTGRIEDARFLLKPQLLELSGSRNLAFLRIGRDKSVIHFVPGVVLNVDIGRRVIGQETPQPHRVGAVAGVDECDPDASGEQTREHRRRLLDLNLNRHAGLLQILLDDAGDLLPAIASDFQDAVRQSCELAEKEVEGKKEG